MKILVVHCGKISIYPPVISLVLNLVNNNHTVTLFAEEVSVLPQNVLDNKRFKGIEMRPYYTEGVFRRAVNAIKRGKWIKRTVEQEMKENDIIWTTTDVTARELGNTLFQYKHIMQLMELIKDIPLFSTQMLIKAHLDRIAQRAYRVVVPEENRAYIQKTWWDLKEKPIVLPNKPYEYSSTYKSISKDIINRLKNEKRKIILYQGIFAGDRNFEEFAEAIQLLGIDKYAFYIMGRDSDIRKKLCEKYSFIEYLGFFSPPDHLQITKYAYIGLLPYIPDKNIPYLCSELNAIYCAPNKIYEYAMYGLPMVGTDVPGLKYPFEKYGIGVCCSKLEGKEIAKSIKYVDNNHEIMSKKCKAFYESVDLDKIVESIIY